MEEQTEISWRQCTRTEETGTVILQAEFQQIPHVIQSFVLKKGTLGSLQARERY